MERQPIQDLLLLGARKTYPLRALIGCTQGVGVSANPREAPIGPPWHSSALLSCTIPPLPLQVSVAGLSLLLLRRALRRERQLQVPDAYGSSPGLGPSADGGGGGGRCGVLSNSGRSGSLRGGWAMADACPNWGDKCPQGKLPMALGPWPLWDQDEEQPENGSAEVEVEVELAAEGEGETDEPPE